MGDMGILVIVLWRVIGRLLRRLGRGILLVPVAAMAPVLFGLSLWTVAVVLLAVVVAFWRPVVAAVVLPVTMVVAGISGLVVAATAPGPTVSWVVSALTALKGRQVKLRGPIARKPPFPRTVEGDRRPGAQSSPRSRSTGQAVAAQAVHAQVAARPRSYGPPAAFAPGGQGPAATPFPGPGIVQLNMKGGPGGPGGAVVWTRGAAIHPGGGIWPGGLLVPLALLLLTLGLWLLPRSAAALRAHTAGMVSYLRHRMLENRWGILLIPVALLGLTVFGVHPWTVALVLASVVTVARWPVIAADLVPVALAAFAVRGFMIAASWQSLPQALMRPGPAVRRDPGGQPPDRHAGRGRGQRVPRGGRVAGTADDRDAHPRACSAPDGTSSWRAGCSG